MTVVECDYVKPMPDVAGWTQVQREEKVADLLREVGEKGGKVLRKAWRRNPAFDKGKQRTTFKMTVAWSHPESLGGDKQTGNDT